MTGRTLVRLPLFVAAVALGLTTTWFVIVGALTRDWYRAWNVLSGQADPFKDHAALELPLAILGFILVPTMIGVVVAGSLELVVKRRVLDDESAEDAMSRAHRRG